MACDDQRSISRGFSAPPLPEDFPVRLGRLEDRSGLPLEEFARRWLLPEDRATEWRCGEPPTAHELRAVMEWAGLDEIKNRGRFRGHPVVRHGDGVRQRAPVCLLDP